MEILVYSILNKFIGRARDGRLYLGIDDDLILLVR